MYIEQAYTKKFDFIKYLPIPVLFLVIMVLNYIAVTALGLDVEMLIRQKIAEEGKNAVFFETVAPLSAALVILLLWVKYVHKQSIRSLTTSRKEIDWSRILFSFMLWGGLMLVLILGAYIINPQDYEIIFDPLSFAILAVLAIIMIPLQTSFEEYLFRGYLMQGIGILSRSRLVPLIFTSVLFGVMHVSNPEVGKLGYTLLIYYIGTGFFLGIITLMDEGLELALGFHAANNLVGVLLITSDWTVFQTHSIIRDKSIPDAFTDILLPVFVVFPLLLYIFNKKYKWNNWKNRLTGPVILVKETNN